MRPINHSLRLLQVGALIGSITLAATVQMLDAGLLPNPDVVISLGLAALATVCLANSVERIGA